MNEEWRKVPGYPNYEISIATKEGKCRNTNYRGTGKTKVLPNTVGKDGRIKWNLIHNQIKTNKQAARWIAISYPELIENEYFEGAEIDHKDTDRLNNRPSNLRWVSRKDNCNNSLTRVHISLAQKGKTLTDTTKKRISQSQKKRLKNSPELCGAKKYVLQYSMENNLLMIYNSAAEAERATKIPHQKISNAATGKCKSAGGYLWEYKEKEVV